MYQPLKLVLATILLISMCASPGWAARESTTLDAGNLYFFVSNNGSFAFDSSQSRDGVDGLYFPKNTLKFLMAGGGIWVAGKKNGEWRATISGDESEFVSGPAYHRVNAASPFPLYKIKRGEPYALNDDYRNWPAFIGAPVDALGQPLVMGAQCLFTMFNDTDSSAHGFNISNTLPLGVEVKLYAYTYDNVYQTFDTMMTQTIFFDYTITNRSDEPIDSCIITLYGDPDIGYEGDDRVGSDTATSSVFCYNDSDYDQYYGSHPPAVGICMLSPAANSANFYFNYRRLDPPSVRLDSLYKTINIVKGLQLMGEPYIDPTTSLPTRFPYSGDVVSGNGWIDTLSKDYRFVLNLSPTLLPAGDSIKVSAALVVAQGVTHLESVQKLLTAMRAVQGQYSNNGAVPDLRISPLDAVAIRGANIRGRDWGGRYLSGGLDMASRYFGDLTMPDRTPKVSIAFSDKTVQQAYRYVITGSEYRFAADENQKIAVTDTRTGSPLECGFIDTDNDGTIADHDGRLEPIIVFTLNSDGSAQSQLTSLDLAQPSPLKLVALQLDASLTDLIGQRLVVDTRLVSEPFTSLYLGDSGSVEIDVPAADAYSERVLMVRNNSRFVQDIDAASSDPLQLSLMQSNKEIGTGDSALVFLHSYPPDSGSLGASISLYSRRLRGERMEFPIAYAPLHGVSGDANEDGALTLVDVIDMVRMLFRDAPVTVPTLLLDANCDGAFDLVDLVIYLNVLYGQGELPCDGVVP